jgi:hypothetical protein
MASDTLGEFLKNVAKFPDRIVGTRLLNDWNKDTAFVMSDAQENAPLASGQLVRSAVQKRARRTKTGIESFYQFQVPYARKLNNERSGVRLKNQGELSWQSKGRKHFKAKKGILGYSNKAVVDSVASDDDWQDIIFGAISRAWAKL